MGSYKDWDSVDNSVFNQQTNAGLEVVRYCEGILSSARKALVRLCILKLANQHMVSGVEMYDSNFTRKTSSNRKGLQQSVNFLFSVHSPGHKRDGKSDCGGLGP
ncbi:hypothetical protein QQP08_000337 [Theobroma cacao]|nr:hypothetical protein QQP08_000337 [Theobroma cacao]